MEIRTYTHIWNSKRTLYSIGDIKLFRPIALSTVGVFLAVAIIWGPLVFTLFNPNLSSPYWWMLIAGPPVAAAYFGDKPVFEDKSVFAFALAQIGYLFEPPAWSDLEVEREVVGTTYTNAQAWWTPHHRGYQKKSRKKSSKRSKRK